MINELMEDMKEFCIIKKCIYAGSTKIDANLCNYSCDLYAFVYFLQRKGYSFVKEKNGRDIQISLKEVLSKMTELIS